MHRVLDSPLFLFLCRLEEKLSNSESENQVLRQQALTMSPTGKAISARPRMTILQVLRFDFFFFILVAGRDVLIFCHDFTENARER